MANNLIAFGGPKHIWQGFSIRCSRINGEVQAIMPNKDSVLAFQVEVERNGYYLLSICAKTNTESELIVEFTGENRNIQQTILKVNPNVFARYSANFMSTGKGKEKFSIKIKKNKNIACEITVREVTISKNDSAPKIEKQVVKTSGVAQDTALIQAEAKRLQKKRDEESKIKQASQISNEGSAGMSIIGGNGYKWKGKNIKIAFKDGVQCVDLPNKDSCVFAKASVLSDSSYKVIIVASKVGGNGAFLVNFFGGTNSDGKHVSVIAQDNTFRDHSIIIPTPKFSPGIPIYLRIWRGDGSTGKIIIKSIRYIKITVAKPAQLLKRKENNPINGKAEAKKPTKIKTKKVMKEEFDMRYRPHNKNESLSKQVDAVFIQEPRDVPRISIITPTRDGAELIKKCYAALTQNTNYPNWEWVVGDSCSNDDTIEFLRQLNDPRIKIIERGTTDGSFSSINNELVKQSDGEYVLFLNNDTEPQPFWLYNMISKIHRNPEIGIVGSRLLYAENKIQHCGIAFIQQGPANIGKAVLKSFPGNYAEFDRFYQSVTAACLLMRRGDFDKVGGFGEEYWFCYEDVDLCLKVKHQLNKKILYSASSMVIHNESVTQRKHRTEGEKQKEGIRIFKQRWMKKVDQDFVKYQTNNLKGMCKPDISFVTCVSNIQQYCKFVVGSLFKNKTTRNYELIPILNHGNKYSAAQALNLGLSKARGNLVIFCHQDVLFYENWIEILFNRIEEIEKKDKNWGVIGTAGITTKDDTIGVVYSLKGRVQWDQTGRSKTGSVQTLDEHCMIIRRNCGLKFDDALTGFHLYGPDMCLSSLSLGMKNYGIFNPLVHSSSSSSLFSGQKEFMKWLNFFASKWSNKFKIIRTPTSMIKGKTIRTFIKF